MRKLVYAIALVGASSPPSFFDHANLSGPACSPWTRSSDAAIR